MPSEGVCELEPDARELTLFVPIREAEVRADGAALEPHASVELEGGLRLRVRVPAGSEALEIRTTGGLGRLALSTPRVPPRLGELHALRRSGALDALAAALDEWEATLDPSADPCDGARLLGMRARLAFSRNEPADVDTLYGASIPALLACGRLSEAIDDGLARAFNRSERLRDFAGARAVLDELEPHAGPYAWGAAWLVYQRALLSMRLGELGAALRQLDEAEARALRLDLADLRSSALQLRSWVLSLLGRHDHAASSADEALAYAPSDAPCDRATVLTNLGWQRVLALEAGRAHADDARAPLVAALALFDGDCPDPVKRAHALINLARLEISQGALQSAEALLRRASDDAPAGDGALEVALLDVRGRVHLDAGDAASALRVYETLSARLRAAGERLPIGALGRAKALLALGRTDEAIEALRESEDELDLQLATVSLGMGRDSLSLGREESAALLVRALVAQGRVDEAFLAARRARARLLWSLPHVASTFAELSPAERRARERLIASYTELRHEMDAAAKDAWTRPEDELAAAEELHRAHRRRLEALLEALFPAIRQPPAPLEPRPGELVLGVFPLGDELYLFALGADGLQVEHQPAHPQPAHQPARQQPAHQQPAHQQPAHQQPAHRQPTHQQPTHQQPAHQQPAEHQFAAASLEALLGPFADTIAAADRLSVIAPSGGPAAQLHRVALGGRPLGLTKPIAYVVDLPRATSRRREEGRLFVLDPRGDLGGAREEARWLRERAPTTARDTWLLGHGATREAVLAALGDARLLHYAGHAVYEGEAWWESGLSLAGRSTLTISDVLAARAVPAEVILVGCGTARARPARHVATVGLAQAFVVAGADHVVATLERIEDRLAAAFSRAYHGGEGNDPAGRLFRAVVDLDERGLDWSAFVLLVP
ncbi:MAG: CHAT domain-containing protein [Myxococcales bacterium]|nr:CHAT domain-containing protein [Myxococcales bacterium]